MAKKTIKEIKVVKKDYITESLDLLNTVLSKSDVYADMVDTDYKDFSTRLNEAEEDLKEITDAMPEDAMPEDEENTEEVNPDGLEFLKDVKVYAKEITESENVEEIKNEIIDLVSGLEYQVNYNFFEIETPISVIEKIKAKKDEEAEIKEVEDNATEAGENNEITGGVAESDIPDMEVISEDEDIDAEGNPEGEVEGDENETPEDETAEETETKNVLYFVVYDADVIDEEIANENKSFVEFNNFLGDNFDGEININEDDFAFLKTEIQKEPEGEETATPEGEATPAPEGEATPEVPAPTEEPKAESKKTDGNVIKENAPAPATETKVKTPVVAEADKKPETVVTPEVKPTEPVVDEAKKKDGTQAEPIKPETKPVESPAPVVTPKVKPETPVKAEAEKTPEELAKEKEDAEKAKKEEEEKAKAEKSIEEKLKEKIKEKMIKENAEKIKTKVNTDEKVDALKNKIENAKKFNIIKEKIDKKISFKK